MTPQRTFRRLLTTSLFTLLIALFLVTILWHRMIITVPAGHAGVMWWRLFGGTDVTAPPKDEGLHIIFPWDHLIVYDTRLQEYTGGYAVVANNGLSLQVTATIRWRIRRKRLGELHRTIGPAYLQRLLVPEVGSILRETISRYKAEDLYANERRAVQGAIYQALVAAVDNGIGGRSDDNTGDLISLTDVLITEVKLPDALRDAIERKFAQAELVEEYKFRVQREELESKRKEVEATGIHKFQEIVTPAISDAYLRWSGIEATLKLAQSPNSKVVIVGNGPGGMPIILNGFEGEKPPPAPQAKSVTNPQEAPAKTLPLALPSQAPSLQAQPGPTPSAHIPSGLSPQLFLQNNHQSN
jgi:regulator of protease activity HflC (stomatin/prohibitin superfamily)